MGSKPGFGNRWLLLTLAVVTVGVWSTGSNGEFVWIDNVEIEQAGYRITSGDDFRAVWTTSLDAYLERNHSRLNTKGGYLRPIYAISISLDWWIWKDNPVLFHWENIAWHLAVVVGLFFLAQQLLLNHPRKISISFFAAMFFAVHPLAVHSVTWISGRKDTMCAAFAIASLIAFGRVLNGENLSLKKKSYWMLVSLSVLLLALFSKELALVTPAFATVWAWSVWQCRRHQNDDDAEVSGRQSWPGAVSILGVAMLWIGSLASIVYRIRTLGSFGLNETYPSESWVFNVATSARLVCTYMVRTVCPLDPTIVDRWRITTGWSLPDVFAVIVLLMLIAAWLYWMFRRKPIGLAAGWFAIWILPATGLVPLRHLYAERYLYPASWGIGLMGALTAAWLIEKNPGTAKPLAALGVGFIFLLSAQSIATNQHWQSNEALFTHAVSQNSNYVEGLTALALQKLDEKDYDEATRLAQSALNSLKEKNYQSYWSPFGLATNAGLADYHRQKYDSALIHFEHAYQARPNSAISHYHLGLVYLAKQDAELAEASFRESLRIDPDDQQCRNMFGMLLLQSLRFDECIEILRPLVAENPDHLTARNNLGSALLAKRQYRLAEPHFQFLVDRQPNAINLAKLAWCQFATVETSADLKQAQSHLERARQLDPNEKVVLDVATMFGQ